MKVWVVMTGGYPEDNDIVSIHATKESAETHRADTDGDEPYIEEWEVTP